MMRAIIVFFGSLLLIFAAIAYGYTETSENSYYFPSTREVNAQQPFLQYAFPLVIGGIILVLLGAIIPAKEPYKKE